MQTIVIIFNVTLACCCLAVARWIWLFRRSLRQSIQVLIWTEIVAHETLQNAPLQIAQGQFNVRQWNQTLAQIGLALNQGRQVVAWAQHGQALIRLMLGRKRLRRR